MSKGFGIPPPPYGEKFHKKSRSSCLAFPSGQCMHTPKCIHAAVPPSSSSVQAMRTVCMDSHLLVTTTKKCLSPQLAPADCWPHMPATTILTMRYVTLLGWALWREACPDAYLHCCCFADRVTRPERCVVAHNIAAVVALFLVLAAAQSDLVSV